MPIYAIEDRVPTIAADAYVHPDAVIIGDVRLGEEASAWPCSVLTQPEGWIDEPMQAYLGSGRRFRAELRRIG